MQDIRECFGDTCVYEFIAATAKGYVTQRGQFVTYSYLFEAKSIQSYIFATNKLKEIIGGSELIEQLTSDNGLLKQTLQSLRLEEGKDIKLSRCGGAAFYAFGAKEPIEKLANLWPLVFRQYAPDMEFIHAKAKGENPVVAFKTAHDTLMADRNRPKVKLPQAGVYTLRFGRTGEPVTQVVRIGKDVERVDQITAKKREFANSEALIKRVQKDSTRNQWPVNLTPENDDDKDFPFKDNRLIGLIHADGNGFGQLLMDLKEVVDDKSNDAINDKNYIKVFRAISEAIKAATEAAAEQAVTQTLTLEDRGLYPARPIVLGGDDLTMIVRTDLALPFTQAFLKAFEQESQNQFNKLREAHPDLNKILPEKLTACAGIVYAKSSQPFSALHDLAEGLCKHAKKIAKKDENLLDGKQVPSSLSFYRVTSTLLDNFDDVLKRELTADKITLSRGCYTLESHKYLPNLTDLLKLQKFLEQSEISRGALRQITGLLHQSAEQAQSRYRRWKEVMIERDEKEKKNNWKTFDELRIKLSHFPEKEKTGTDFNIEHKQAVPFEDVLSLSAVGNNINPMQGEQE
jgi:hypothetical protein